MHGVWIKRSVLSSFATTYAFEFAMAMSIIEDIEQEEREQEKDSFGEDDDDELFDDDCAQKCAGHPSP